VAYVESSRRVGRSQAASIFWGLVSVCFAAAACYYYWNNHENETSASVLRDQVLTLQEERDSLSAQKDKLQSSISDSETQLKSREDFLQEKETRLAEEETRLEALDQKSQASAQAEAAQAAVIKKFNDTARKLAQNDTDVIVREGRPVLRVPDSALFSFGGAALKPEGKALLSQIAQPLNGQAGDFELRIETFTDVGELRPPDETAPPTAVNLNGKTAPAAKTDPAKTPPPLAPPPDKTTWDLTGARAAAIARYFHDEGSLPFRSVVVVPRSDTDPIEAGSTEGHARNRRTEITLVPAPAPFHGTDAAASSPAPAAAPTPAKAAPGHNRKTKMEKVEKTEKADKTDKTDKADKTGKAGNPSQ
jgi:flagellar motor protein MotB